MSTKLSKTNKEKLRKALRKSFNSNDTRMILDNVDAQLTYPWTFGFQSVELQYVETVHDDGTCELCYDIDNMESFKALVIYGVDNQPKVLGYPNLMCR